LRAPFVALAEPVTLVASVGAAVVDRSDVPAAQALQHAYIAMRAAQRRGGDRAELFRPSLSGRAVSRLEDERALRRALPRAELRLHYQPIVWTMTGGMSGVEALLRWEHPERGLVPAAEFIAVAEDAGFIGELGWWALRTACAEVARWSARAPAFRVSVNVSARQLAHPGFADVVFGALADTEASPSSLCLELTEASLLDDIAESAQRLQTVRDGGVTVAVDDFGTGYSSLGYLQQLPIDTVKIDRSFVKDLGHTPAGDTITSAVVGLAHGLGLTTVAEGVETEAQARALSTIGCDYLQGYLCSPARPAAEIDELLGAPLVPGMIDLRFASAGEGVTVR
jgi:EAL domain-containing protein (putative c-di-GMP-specific phosphodiesterase class I)